MRQVKGLWEKLWVIRQKAVHHIAGGELISCDIHPHKIKLLEAGRERLGLSIVAPALQNAAQPRED